MSITMEVVYLKKIIPPNSVFIPPVEFRQILLMRLILVFLLTRLFMNAST